LPGLFGVDVRFSFSFFPFSLTCISIDEVPPSLVTELTRNFEFKPTLDLSEAHNCKEKPKYGTKNEKLLSIQFATCTWVDRQRRLIYRLQTFGLNTVHSFLAVFLWATAEVSLFKCEPYRLHLPYFKPLPLNLSP